MMLNFRGIWYLVFGICFFDLAIFVNSCGSLFASPGIRVMFFWSLFRWMFSFADMFASLFSSFA